MKKDKSNETFRFAKPKICLVDIDAATEDAIREAGFNVTTGTLGTPRNVKRTDQLHPVDEAWATLKGFSEQEILFVNTAKPEAVSGELVASADGVPMLWQSAKYGEIDTRPLVADLIRSNFDQIMANGGIAVVFLAAKYHCELVQGVGYGINFRESDRFELSSWGLSSDLDNLRFDNASGEEITFLSEGNDLFKLLSRERKGPPIRCELARSTTMILDSCRSRKTSLATRLPLCCLKLMKRHRSSCFRRCLDSTPLRWN